MKAYLSFFKIRFINGLQYRAAAYAGIATQLAWGFMYIMMYHTFYKTNPSARHLWIFSNFQVIYGYNKLS